MRPGLHATCGHQIGRLVVTERQSPIASPVTPTKKRSQLILTFPKRKSRHSSEVALHVAKSSRHPLLTVFQSLTRNSQELTCQKRSDKVRPATEQAVESGCKAIPLNVLLAYLRASRASLIDKDAMLRAERLSAMAHSVSLLSIRSYHCHESGCYAKDVSSGRGLGHGLHMEDVCCVYNTTSMSKWSTHELLN